MRDLRGLLIVLAAVVMFDVALVVGADRGPVATTVIREPIGTPSRAAPRGSGSGTPVTAGAAAIVACTTPPPSPTWVCQNGSWMMVGTADATGGGAITPAGNGTSTGGAGNCLGVQPGAGWGCRGGAWMPPTAVAAIGPAAGGSSAPITPDPPPASPVVTPDTPPSTSSIPGQMGCTAPNPAAGMPGVVARCVNGTWVIGG